MPIYEYEHVGTVGEGCSPHFQTFQAMSEAHLEVCPTCQAPVRRLISQVGFSMNSGKVNYDKAATRGFATYRKAEAGKYEKIAGEGPSMIDRDQV